MRDGDRLAMIPVSLSDGVEPGARTGTSVGGQQVVIWRGTDGAVRAWADQCPHRGMRLSFGFVRESSLVCIYHGWSFGSPPAASPAARPDVSTDVAAVRCLAVPAHPAMAPPVKGTVTAFPVAEALGMIWVGASPDDTELPADAVPAAEAVHPVRSVTVGAPAPALRAALEAALPPGTEIAEIAEIAAATRAAGVVITFKGPELRVIAAIQDRGDGAASAHIVTTNPDTGLRKALCLWAVLVRDHLAAVALP
jgi:hypothetical protein